MARQTILPERCLGNWLGPDPLPSSAGRVSGWLAGRFSNNSVMGAPMPQPGELMLGLGVCVCGKGGGTSLPQSRAGDPRAGGLGPARGFCGLARGV